jgi:hypothetical protein
MQDTNVQAFISAVKSHYLSESKNTTWGIGVFEKYTEKMSYGVVLYIALVHPFAFSYILPICIVLYRTWVPQLPTEKEHLKMQMMHHSMFSP